MRLLFLGDIVGEDSCNAVCELLNNLIFDCKLDFVIVNGENAADGFGITGHIADNLFDAGVDVITTGNHFFDKHCLSRYLMQNDKILRPANYPDTTYGKGSGLYRARNGANVLVANLMGKIYMYGQLDDPFAKAEEIIKNCPLGQYADAIIVDFHAEATSEKQCLGHYLDGRISLLVGTHTHVPTADYKIMPAGTGYISDLGMCGNYDSSLGLDKQEPLNKFLGKNTKKFEVAIGEITICGIGVDISDSSGLVEKIEPIIIGGALAPRFPSFWK
ncbi:TIGR00282 family metallophosphoesterase [Bartonella sp. DGB1]|uniref:TIGR00282 family metallophosphoesterase n=1 Tax=Bartonella sp. DGB1 TaxID=3239807 RepID=UPI003523EEDF